MEQEQELEAEEDADVDLDEKGTNRASNRQSSKL